MCQMILTPVIPTSIHPRSAAGIYLPISLCPRQPTSHGTWVVDFDWLHACSSRSISLLSSPTISSSFPIVSRYPRLLYLVSPLVDRGRDFFLLSVEKLVSPFENFVRGSVAFVSRFSKILRAVGTNMIFNNRRYSIETRSRAWAYYSSWIDYYNIWCWKFEQESIRIIGG